MSVKISQNNSGKPLKLLTWDKVSFIDGQEDKHPVKNITIHIEAGASAYLTVERYAMNEIFDAVSDDPKDGHKPLTYKTHYAIGEFDANIDVRGPFKGTVCPWTFPLPLLSNQKTKV